tara:strand:- start:53 stop:757 length:705 start_codon:yes stop_codon:yes gene_type:complete
MEQDNSFKEVAVVMGSNGGLGKSIYNNLRNTKKSSKVFGFHRKSNPPVDVTNEKSVIEIANFLKINKFRISILINAVGYLHDDKFKPEKKIEDLNVEYFKKSCNINTISTILLLKYLAPLMYQDKNSLFVSLSARVGSIEDNHLGGWYSYRASKAALNQIIKTASIEFKRKKSDIIFLSLHPGTVDTYLSKPFSNKKTLFSPELAAEKILNTLKRLSINQSGRLIDYNGDIIPY